MKDAPDDHTSENEGPAHQRRAAVGLNRLIAIRHGERPAFYRAAVS